MKQGKILIAMILLALGFQVNAQRAVFVHESYHSVRKYIHPLRLSQGQVHDWNRLNRRTDIQIRDVERERYLTARMRANKIERIFDRKDRKLRNILSRRQYEKFRNMRGHHRGHRSRYNRSDRYNDGYYDDRRRNDRDDRRRRDRDRDRNNNSGCPANSNYYDGGYYYG